MYVYLNRNQFDLSVDFEESYFPEGFLNLKRIGNQRRTKNVLFFKIMTALKSYLKDRIRFMLNWYQKYHIEILTEFHLPLSWNLLQWESICIYVCMWTTIAHAKQQKHNQREKERSSEWERAVHKKKNKQPG
jgi:hypothetical protein